MPVPPKPLAARPLRTNLVKYNPLSRWAAARRAWEKSLKPSSARVGGCFLQSLSGHPFPAGRRRWLWAWTQLSRPKVLPGDRKLGPTGRSPSGRTGGGKENAARRQARGSRFPQPATTPRFGSVVVPGWPIVPLAGPRNAPPVGPGPGPAEATTPRAREASRRAPWAAFVTTFLAERPNLVFSPVTAAKNQLWRSGRFQASNTFQRPHVAGPLSRSAWGLSVPLSQSIPWRERSLRVSCTARPSDTVESSREPVGGGLIWRPAARPSNRSVCPASHRSSWKSFRAFRRAAR